MFILEKVRALHRRRDRSRANLARRADLHPETNILDLKIPRILTGTRQETGIAVTRCKQSTDQILTGTDSRFFTTVFRRSGRARAAVGEDARYFEKSASPDDALFEIPPCRELDTGHFVTKEHR